MIMLRAYQNALRRRPVLVQALQTGTLMAVGDVIAQTYIEKKELQSIDIQRTMKFSSIGFFFAGPALRIWYGVLNKRLGSSKVAALQKVVIDQFIMAPIFIAALLGCVGLLQGKNTEEIKQDLKSTYKDVLIANYYIWPVVQTGNFLWVPLQYQVLVVQVVAVFWNTYLSWKANQPGSPKVKSGVHTHV